MAKRISIISVFLVLTACTFHGHKDIPLNRIYKVPKNNHIVIHNEYYRYVLDDIVFSEEGFTGYKVRGIGNGFNDYQVRLKAGSPLNSDKVSVSLKDIEKIMFYGKGNTHEMNLKELDSVYKDNIIIINDGYGSFLLENAELKDGIILSTRKKFVHSRYKGMNRIMISLITHNKLNSEKVTIQYNDIESVSTYLFEPWKPVLFYTGGFAVLVTAFLLII